MNRALRAAVAAVALAAGLVALPPGAALAGPVSHDGTSTCDGSPVTVSFSATFADAVPAGGEVVAAQPAVRIVVPAATVDGWRSGGVTAVDASAVAELTYGTATATVAGLSTSDVALPESGDLTVTLTGQAPGMPAQAGEQPVALGRLAALVAHDRSGSRDLGCTEVPGAPLTTVAVAPTAQAPAILADTPLLTAHFLVDGTSRIAKLGSDLKLTQGTFDAGLYNGDAGTIRIEGDLAIPPTTGYFIAFRFMPVTSLVQLPQTEKATGTADISSGLFTPDIDVTVRVNLTVGDVREDGVPIEVGDSCHAPLVIRMRGRSSLTPGSQSTIQSTFDIPPFTGCGVTENLDPLLTGLISGPGNTMTTTLTAQGVG